MNGMERSKRKGQKCLGKITLFPGGDSPQAVRLFHTLHRLFQKYLQFHFPICITQFCTALHICFRSNAYSVEHTMAETSSTRELHSHPSGATCGGAYGKEYNTRLKRIIAARPPDRRRICICRRVERLVNLHFLSDTVE
jgi:hypothetical protein